MSLSHFMALELQLILVSMQRDMLLYYSSINILVAQYAGIWEISRIQIQLSLLTSAGEKWV